MFDSHRKHHGEANAVTLTADTLGGYATDSSSFVSWGTWMRERLSARGPPARKRTCQPKPPSAPAVSPLSVSGSAVAPPRP